MKVISESEFTAMDDDAKYRYLNNTKYLLHDELLDDMGDFNGNPADYKVPNEIVLNVLRLAKLKWDYITKNPDTDLDTHASTCAACGVFFFTLEDSVGDEDGEDTGCSAQCPFVIDYGPAQWICSTMGHPWKGYINGEEPTDRLLILINEQIEKYEQALKYDNGD
jgi:hypothetical protein